MIYVHIPFCRSFCTYCDFYSEVAAKCREAQRQARQNELFESFSDALGREISLRAGEMSDKLNTLYIGGGTPSVLPLSVYTSLVESLAEAGICGPFEEFTFEANPEDIVEKGEAYIEELMKLGVNRFSMGVQSFDDGILKWMNRRHDAATARKAYSILENAGADNISIDLIFGLPQLADSVWKDTLDQALGISSRGVLPRHISSYQLSVEPGSALAKLVDRGVWSEASDELCTRQYDMLCEALAAAGYHHYEISNFAQPGFEAKHNSAYWAHIPYVGLGPGAHSFEDSGRCRMHGNGIFAPPRRERGPVQLGGDHWNTSSSTAIRQWNNPDLHAYIADPQSVQDHEELNEEQLVLEKIMLALRTSAGISEDFLRTHVSEETMRYALGIGDLVPSHISDNLRIPETRFFVSDNIISYLCGS